MKIGRSFIKGYLAIKWHFDLIKYPNKRWAWSEDPLKKQAEIKKVMTYKIFQVMNKHFAVVNKDQLPLKGTPDYHPLQNISAGAQVLKENFAGSMLCIDEGRVKSKSKRNPYKIRNPENQSKWGGQYTRLENGANLVVMPLLIILQKSGAKHILQLPMEKPITLLINCLTPTKERVNFWCSTMASLQLSF